MSNPTANANGTASSFITGANSTIQHPSANDPDTALAASSDNRVLPVPPTVRLPTQMTGTPGSPALVRDMRRAVAAAMETETRTPTVAPGGPAITPAGEDAAVPAGAGATASEEGVAGFVMIGATTDGDGEALMSPADE